MNVLAQRIGNSTMVTIPSYLAQKRRIFPGTSFKVSEHGSSIRLVQSKQKPEYKLSQVDPIPNLKTKVTTSEMLKAVKKDVYEQRYKKSLH